MGRYGIYNNTPRDVRRDEVHVQTLTYSDREVSGKVRDIIEKMKNNKYIDLAYVIQSFTDPTKKYVVSRLKNGEWRCTCPMFKFNIPAKRYLHKAYRLPSGQLVCKHVAWVYQNMKMLTPVIDRTHGRNIVNDDFAVNVVDLNGLEGRIVSVGGNIAPLEEEKEKEREFGFERFGDSERATSSSVRSEFNFSIDDMMFLDEDMGRARANIKKGEGQKKERHRGIEIGF